MSSLAGRAGDAGRAGGSRIAGNVVLQLLARVLGMGIGVLTLPLMTRTLGTEGYGTWATATAYVSLFSVLTEFGLATAASMRMAADPEHEADWLGAMASLRTLLGVALTLVALAGVPLVLGTSGAVPRTAAILALGISATGAAALMAVFQARLRGGIPLLVASLQSGLWLATVVALAIADASAEGFAAGFLGVSLVVAAVQVAVVRRLATVAWRGVRDRWRELLRVALPVGLGSIFTTIYYKLDVVLLNGMASTQEAGIYGAAYRFLDPLVHVPAVLVGAFFPVLSAAIVDDRARVQRLVQTCAELLGIVAAGVFAATLVVAGPVVRLLAGEDFADSAGLLPILMGAFAAICYGNLAGFLAPVLGLQWRFTAVAALGAVVNVGLNVALIPHYGATGSAWATLVTETVTMGLLLASGLRHLGLRLAPGRLTRTVLAAGLMGLAMWPAGRLGLLPALVVGALVYPAALLALRAVDPAELLALRRDRAG